LFHYDFHAIPVLDGILSLDSVLKNRFQPAFNDFFTLLSVEGFHPVALLPCLSDRDELAQRHWPRNDTLIFVVFVVLGYGIGLLVLLDEAQLFLKGLELGHLVQGETVPVLLPALSRLLHYEQDQHGVKRSVVCQVYGVIRPYVDARPEQPEDRLVCKCLLVRRHLVLKLSENGRGVHNDHREDEQPVLISPLLGTHPEQDFAGIMHIALVHLVRGVNIDFLVRGVCQ